MSGSRHSRKAKTAKYTKRLQTELQSMIAYACYDSDYILTSGKTMKKEVLCDTLLELYMPSPGDTDDVEEEAMSHVDMCLKGLGKFKGLWNMEEDEKSGESLILSKKIHTLDDEMYVGPDCICRSLLTRKNLTNKADIKKERLYFHAKDVETNCTKALRLCLSSDSPYKSFYQNNGKYPSGQNWFDYAKWIRKEMHQLITKSGGTKDFDVLDPVDLCNDSDDDDVMDEVQDGNEDQTKSEKKKSPTKKRNSKNEKNNSNDKESDHVEDAKENETKTKTKRQQKIGRIKKARNKKKKTNNTDDDDSDYVTETESSSEEEEMQKDDVEKKDNVDSPKKASSNDDETNDPPKDVYFKGYFSFLLWGYIPPPGYEEYKSLSMTTVEKKGERKRDKKTLGRAASRKKDAENKLIDGRFEMRGTSRYDGVEKKITDLMVKGRIEMQTQKTFAVKKEKLEFLLKYEVDTISDLRADFWMCSSEDESEKLELKNKIKEHQKERDKLKKEWEIITDKEQKRREVIVIDWNEDLEKDEDIDGGEEGEPADATNKVGIEKEEIDKAKDGAVKVIDSNEKKVEKHQLVNNPILTTGTTNNENETALGNNSTTSSANKNNTTDDIEDNSANNALGNSNDENNDTGDGDEDFKKIIKSIKGGIAYENMFCSFCGKMQTNHYCCAVVPGSNVQFDNKKDEVCGKAMCLLCRSNWGDPEKYMNYCNIHHPDNNPTAEATKIDTSQKKISIANTSKGSQKKTKSGTQKKQQPPRGRRNRKSSQTTARASTRASKRTRK